MIIIFKNIKGITENIARSNIKWCETFHLDVDNINVCHNPFLTRCCEELEQAGRFWSFSQDYCNSLEKHL